MISIQVEITTDTAEESAEIVQRLRDLHIAATAEVADRRRRHLAAVPTRDEDAS